MSSSPEVANTFRQLCQQGKAFGRGGQKGARVSRFIQKGDEIEDLARLERSPFDPQLLRRHGNVRNTAEIDPDGRTGARGRVRSGTQVLDAFSCLRQGALDRRLVRRRFDALERGCARRGRDVAPHEGHYLRERKSF